MLRNGRVADNGIKANHCLYYRFVQEDLLGDRLNPTRIPIKNTSVNWSKHSKPWDVIFDHPGLGIARFIVRMLPFDLPRDRPNPPSAKNPPKVFAFYAEHDPLDENYSHCEIRTYKEGVRDIKCDLPATVKKEYRTSLADHALILWHPTI